MTQCPFADFQNMLDPDTYARGMPYDELARIRKSGPIHYMEDPTMGVPYWLVTGRAEIDSISKRYSACGARVGALVTRNQDVLGAVLRYAKLRLSPPGFGQILAEATLEMEDTYINEVKEEYRRRRDVVYARLSQMPGVVSYRPGGAFYCFAKFPVDSAEHFCQWLLEEFEYNGATVMLSPGEGFYATPGLGVDEARLAYVLNCHDLEAAMDCLEAALKEYPGRIQAKEEISAGLASR